MKFKSFAVLVLFGAAGVYAGYHAYERYLINKFSILQVGDAAMQMSLPDMPDRKNLYGDYLASQFAQQHHDWRRAGTYLSDVLTVTPDDPLVLKRAMILAMGAGDTDKSIALAEKAEAAEKDNALALLFLATGALHDKKYERANEYLKRMPPGSLSDFITPLLESWTLAGMGVYNTDKLTKNIVHINHALLIADYLHKNDEVKKLLDAVMAMQPPSPPEAERIADIYAHVGEIAKASELYQKVLTDWPDSPTVAAKIEAIKAGKEPMNVQPPASPESGIALALYNMSQILYQEYADESARVFANIALYLDPSLTDAELLLAAITARNDRYTDAIDYYRGVKPESEYYLESRRRAADLLEEAGRTDEALAELNKLVQDNDDLESLIRIGDIYRKQQDFKKAVETYDDVAKRLGRKIPKEHWQLLYARGMSLEQLGRWEDAEADLKAALVYQPDHPYVLNYLGYAWTDQGVNLDQALRLIKKAAALRPEDGYITDSLGWVYYRRGEYKDAVKPLENAVELLPYDPVINDHLGDAYWQVGRKLEARFQWQRAKNYSKDAKLIGGIEVKLAQGLEKDAGKVQEMHTQAQPPVGMDNIIER